MFDQSLPPGQRRCRLTWMRQRSTSALSRAEFELVGDKMSGEEVSSGAGRHDAADQSAMARPGELEALSSARPLDVGDEASSVPASHNAPDLGATPSGLVLDHPQPVACERKNAMRWRISEHSDRCRCIDREPDPALAHGHHLGRGLAMPREEGRNPDAVAPGRSEPPPAAEQHPGEKAQRRRSTLPRRSSARRASQERRRPSWGREAGRRTG